MIITFCGHSNFKAEQGDEGRALQILENIAKGEQVDFYLGGYGGFDRFALRCAKKYKETHPDTKLIFISPYQNKWLEDRRAQIEKEYDEIIYPELERVPLKFAILKRNEFMVGQADHVICYVQTHYGGAYKTLLYAHKRKKSYVNLYQGDYELY